MNESAPLTELQGNFLARIRAWEHACEWYTLDEAEPGSAAEPLISSALCLEREGGRLFRPSFDGTTARDAAWLLGGRLPTREEILALSRWNHVPPQTFDVSTPEKQREGMTLRACYRHSDNVNAAGGTVLGAWDNEGKHPILPGAYSGLRLCGWHVRTDAEAARYGLAPGDRLVQDGTRDQHGASHVDYSQTLRVVIDPYPARVERAIEVSLAQPQAPGDVYRAEYFRRATRGGKPTGYSAAWDWCAAGACFTASEAGLLAHGAPHDYAIAVWEIVASAQRVGTFEDWAPGVAPRRGDLLIYARAGEDPRRPGNRGHVDRFLEVTPGGIFRTISANSPGWQKMLRDPGKAGIVGIVRY